MLHAWHAVIVVDVSDGQITVIYNGKQAATYKSDCKQCFFKAGSYLQTPPVNEDTSIGRVSIYSLEATHT